MPGLNKKAAGARDALRAGTGQAEDAGFDARPRTEPLLMLAWLQLSVPMRTMSWLLLAIATAALLLPSLGGSPGLALVPRLLLAGSVAGGLLQFVVSLRLQFGMDLAGVLFREAHDGRGPLDVVRLSVMLLLARAGGIEHATALPLLVDPWPKLRRCLRWQMAWLGLQSGCVLAVLPMALVDV